MAKDQNSEAAKKVADAEKASKKNAAKKDGKPNIFVRAAKAVAKYFKDLRGETKKIVWPSAKLVLKNTGIVLVVVLIVGIAIWAIDFACSAGLGAIFSIDTGAGEVAEGVTEAIESIASTTAAG